ncbi:MAG: glycosyltransferase family 2 protein [Actinomycetota bacterium]
MTALSVICAFHNAAPYLPALLQTLARSTYSDFELILIDDGSADDPSQAIDMFSDELQSVSLLHNETPLGPATSRNLGMAASSAPLLTFVDADDWLSPTFLATLVDTIDDLDVDFVRSNQTRVTGTRRELYRAPDARYHRRLDPSTCILPPDRATMVDFPYTHSGIYRRALYDSGLLALPEGLFTAEDRPWVWRLHLECQSYARTPDAGYFYRRGVPTSLTQVGDVRQLDFIPALQLVLDLVVDQQEHQWASPKAVRQTLSVVHRHITLRDRLTPELQAKMMERVRTLVGSMPADLVSLQLNEIGFRRADQLRHAIPELGGR